MALFNSSPVLDKGFVSYVHVGLPTKQMNKLSHHYFKASLPANLIKLASATLILKCPLFVNLYLTQNFDLTLIPVVGAGEEAKIETYVPNEGDIRATDVVVSKEIREHIEETASALEVTSKGYEKDGCDHFIAQVNLPISVYNEVIASGSLDKWIRFMKQKNLPAPIEAYRKAVYDSIKADFPNLEQLLTKVI